MNITKVLQLSLGLVLLGFGMRGPLLGATNFPGIVAWWPMQGSGADVSGRGHPLSLEGQPLFGDGEVGQSLFLDGRDDYARAAAHPDLDLGANDGMTIELWVDPARTAPQQPLVEWSDNISADGLHFWISVVSPWAGGGPRSLFANVIDRDGVAHHVSSAPNAIASNAFTHVAFTYSKLSGLARLYANGQVVAQTNIGSITPETRLPVYVGWRPLGGGQYRFAGKLDEITLYSRELSQEELNSIYEAGSAGKLPPPPPPPLLHEDFDLSRDFGLTNNPAGPWSYGWKSNFTSGLELLADVRTFTADNGVPIRAWERITLSLPVVAKVLGTNTAISDGGRFTAPGGTVYFAPGADQTPHNYGVIRFTAPSNGNYRIETAVQQLFDSTRSRDSDFHVLKDGAELFGVFLDPNTGTNFSAVVALGAGGTLEFAVGRGADGLTSDSGLKIAVVITPTTNDPTVISNPPPDEVSEFNVGRDFSASSNPNGVWSFGWKANLGGAYSNLTVQHTSPTDNGVLIPSWQLTSSQAPAVYCNTSSITASFGGGAGHAEPGTIWFNPGENGRPENFGVIRFTAPSNGNYQIVTSVHPVYEGAPQGDTDFHVLKSGSELFGQFLSPTQSASFTGVVALAANDAIDFAIGRGADGNQYGSGLKIAAVITPTTNDPTVISNPPPDEVSEFNVGRDFSATANPNGVWSFGWKANLGGAYSNLTVQHTSPTDNGVLIPSWQLTSGQAPAVYCNTSSITASFGGGAGHAEPGTVWYSPGENGQPQNFGVIRFTAPSNGNYQIVTSVHPVYEGAPQGDTDFHVLKDGSELFGQFLSATQSASFTGVVALAANEVIDFAIGRGADGSQYGSSLKIAAVITPTSGASVVSAASTTDHAVEITVIAGGTCVVECSTNLIDWIEAQLPIIATDSGKIVIKDAQAGSILSRYYRARPVHP